MQLLKRLKKYKTDNEDQEETWTQKFEKRMRKYPNP